MTNVAWLLRPVRLRPVRPRTALSIRTALAIRTALPILAAMAVATAATALPARAATRADESRCCPPACTAATRT